jgi:hypothetical protein
MKKTKSPELKIAVIMGFSTDPGSSEHSSQGPSPYGQPPLGFASPSLTPVQSPGFVVGPWGQFMT